MLKCVMLDFGNTIIDFNDTRRMARVYTKIFKKYGHDVRFSEVKKVREEETIKYHTEKHGKASRHYYHPVVRRVLKRLGYDISENMAKKMAKEINKEISKGNNLFPGTRGVLSRLKKRKLRIALICNGTRDWVEFAIKKFGLRDYFDYVLISEQLGKEKSALTPFRVVMRELQVKPDECLMVGDRLDEDMHAKRLGIKTCHAAYGPQVPLIGKKIRPDFTIKDIGELPALVDRLMN